MYSSTPSRTPWGSSEKALAVLLAIGAALGILLSPLGLEPRSNEIRTLAFAAFFIVVGMLLPILALILLYLRRPRAAGILAVIDAALLFLTAPADQALFFFTVPPPLAVSVGEYVLIFIGIGYILLGPRVFERGRDDSQ